METPCSSKCRLLFCDFISRDCLLSPAQITRLRPDLLKPQPEPEALEVPSRRAYFTTRKRLERQRTALKRITNNPYGIYARRRMRNLERVNAGG